MKHSFPRVILYGFVALLIASNFTALTGCAGIVPPTGGPRDSIPPLLISVSPADSSRNFEGKKINFIFNEFVQVDNPFGNMLISPTPKSTPNVEARLRTVTVTIRDTLEPNTTYTFDFGDAIKDINESNILRNFRYIFSTGDVIDSLQFFGRVLVAESGKVDSTLLVFLYPSLDDSAVLKERPRYIARLDNTGSFAFRNLPPGKFAIYAVKDEGGQRRYMSRTQRFAFSDTPVVVQSNPTSVTLYAFVPIDTTTPPPASSIKAVTPARPATDRRLRIESSLVNEQLGLLDTLHLYFRTAPLKFFDSSKLQLTGEKFEPLSNYSFVQDTSNKQVTILHAWTENTAYNLIIDKDFAEDTTGRKLTRTDTISFRTKRERDYGLVRLRFPNLDLSTNPVLLFLQNDKIITSHVFTTKEFYAKLFEPGEYDMRIVLDANKNGRWDTGEFFGEHRQPERVVPISRRITVKANWDNEVDITL